MLLAYHPEDTKRAAPSVALGGDFEALRASNYLARSIWRSRSGYDRRSRVGTKMHCTTLPGQRLKLRDFDRQVAEVQVRIAIMIGSTALGIPVTQAVG